MLWLAVTFEAPKNVTGSVEVVSMLSSSYNDIGYGNRDNRVYCCTTEHLDWPGCSEPGRLIVLPSSRSTTQSKIVRFNNQKRAKLDGASAKFNINRTGEYALLFVNCDSALNVSVRYFGKGEWMNPFGYLPGRLYGFLPVRLRLL